MKIRFAVIVSLSCLVGEVWGQDKPAVAVSPIVRQSVLAGRSFVGAVVPARHSIIGSAVDGRVMEMFVEDGDAVSWQSAEGEDPGVGQPIAQLRTGTITLEIAIASAELTLREQELAEAEAGLQPEEVEQAAARLNAATALMQYAKTRFVRVKALHAANTSSKEEFEQAQSVLVSAEQRQLEAIAAHRLAVQGPRTEVIEQARARMQAALETVNRLKDMRKKYTIRAPFNGYVTVKHTEVGAWLSRGDPVAEVIEVDPIEVRVAVPESYIANVHTGDDAQIRVAALSEPVILGKIARIVPLADDRSRTFPVIIRLENPRQAGHHLLKAGMLAHVTIGVGQEQAALTVPKDALVLRGNSVTVVVIDVDPKTNGSVARVVPVTLGVAVGSWIQVSAAKNALQEEQQVATRGNERLRDQQAVEIVEFERAQQPPPRNDRPRNGRPKTAGKQP